MSLAAGNINKDSSVSAKQNCHLFRLNFAFAHRRPREEVKVTLVHQQVTEISQELLPAAHVGGPVVLEAHVQVLEFQFQGRITMFPHKPFPYLVIIALSFLRVVEVCQLQPSPRRCCCHQR